MRALRLGTGLVLVAALAGGCGDGPSTNASEEDFCQAYNSLYDSLADMTGDDPEKVVGAMKDWADGMADVGTPEDMPDDARDGFELIVSTVEDLDRDASAEDLDKLEDDFSGDEQKSAEAFSAYATKTCPMEMPDMPDAPEMPELEDQMSELESELGELTSSP